ncbi:zinc ribbon domain-containing protein [bacterium]|nr:zinc ribbon domain-containing protein [bacterium]
MPTYDYQCKECGHRFEEFQSMKDPVLEICPACNKPALQRLIGAGAGLLFKGSGYYLTDYKKSSSSAAASSSSEESSTASSSTAAPSEKNSNGSASSTTSSSKSTSTEKGSA